MRLEGIGKGFPGVQALEDISIDLRSGEIHALLGENGAGKSTLIKIISGVIQPDSGNIWFEGKKVHFPNPKEAQKLGISAAFQEEVLFQELSVAENIFMNELPRRAGGLLDQKKLYNDAYEFLQSIGLSVDPKAKVKHLSTAQRQLIQVARAILTSAKVLIFDEPATALTPMEREVLLSMMNQLKEKGAGIIFITHHLEESLRISNRATILRDGKKILTSNTSELSENEVIKLMVGRELLEVYPEKSTPLEAIMLNGSNLTKKPHFENLNFYVREGEVLGIAGLTGCGKSELASALFGSIPIAEGQIALKNRVVRIQSTRDAIELGIFLVPQDRSRALYLSKSIRENMSLSSLRKYSKSGILHLSKEKEEVKQVIQLLNVKSPSINTSVRALSGGNRQKVLIGRAHLTDPRILILVEPTLGIDIGARKEIYQTIHELAREGRSVILVSSDVAELVGVSHRILVMRKGKITGELTNEWIKKEAVMALMVNENHNEKRSDVCAGTS